jgi:hypothetical protein
VRAALRVRFCPGEKPPAEVSHAIAPRSFNSSDASGG